MGRKIILLSESLNKRKFYFSFYLFVLTFSLYNASCGYMIEGSNPPLPNEAKTISILPIQNHTFIAGLETDLSDQLNQTLRSNSSLRIVPAEIADLQLNITLLKISTDVSGLSKEQISSGVNGTITGSILLVDMRINKNIWQNAPITVNITESLENEMESTSGISISGRTRQLIKLFSLNIYERLFYTF